MLFNSVDFAIFLPTVFLLYWFVFGQNLRLQNILIVVASYIFYGWWDWRFLTLILFSTLVDYSVGRKLNTAKEGGQRKLLLWTSIVVNLGFLGFFKYYNFFVDNFQNAFTFFGSEIKINTLHIILPVGISFYTFQTLSYTIDVYKGKMKATNDFIAFSAFVSFFPQLVAGPIERATHLLPQFSSKRKFDYGLAVSGMRQILWGLFKKVVIADNCASLANEVFNNSTEMNGSTLLLGAFFFTFQIYGDFSGYSDIAIGVSRLFGFDLMKNFAFPYFSRDIAEFWRRWHISLSTWFRDYLYIPLGGSRGGTKLKVRNTFIIFLVSGFWHGANWTFVIWGLLNALYFLPLLLTNNNRNHLEIIGYDGKIPSFKEVASMALTFILTVLAWIFFRAENVGHALSYIGGIFSQGIVDEPMFSDTMALYKMMALLILFLCIEWFGRRGEYAISEMKYAQSKTKKWLFYAFLIVLITVFAGRQQEFIYFQF